MKRSLIAGALFSLVVFGFVIVGCGVPATPPPPVVETVIVKETSAPVLQTVVRTVIAQATVVQTVVQTVVVPPTATPRALEGQTVNIVTFTGPQIAEPLQRRAPEFERLTGAKINIVTVPFSDLEERILTDASGGANAYDAWVFDPQWLGDFVSAGIIQDLNGKIADDQTLHWNDVAPFFREYSSRYQGKVYAIPLDGDLHLLYYRADLVEKDGMKPPETWDEYLAMAKKYNGQDLNGDGTADYGSCLFKKSGAQSFRVFTDIAASLVQAQGTRQGTFFNPENMQPLVNNDAFKRALEIYKATGESAPPDELSLDVGNTRALFVSGRCALTVDWGDVGSLALNPAISTVQDKVGAAILPGSKEVLDRTTGKLVACDTKTCPYALNGVNHAPYAAIGGWSGGVNTNSKVKDAAYAFLAYLSAPAQSNVDVTNGKTGFNPYRISQFLNRSEWVNAGMSPKAAANFLGAIETSLTNPNVALDLRIPQNQYYQLVLDHAIAQYFTNEITLDQAVKQIEDAWNIKTDELGRQKQLAAYKASLAGIAQ